MKIIHGSIAGLSFVFVSFSLAKSGETVDIAGYQSRLGFENVAAFKGASEKLSTLGDGVEVLGEFLQDRALDLDAKREVDKELPRVKEALNANPAQCALVYVRVDSQSNGTGTQYSVRDARLMGVGDSAVQAIAPVLFQNSKSGSIDKGPKEGFELNDTKSHLLCFGIRDGKLIESVVWMGAARSSIAEAVEKMKKEEEAAAKSKKPVPKKKKALPNPSKDSGFTSDHRDIMADRMRERAEKSKAEKAQADRAQKEKGSADKAQADKQRADRDKKTSEPKEKPKPEPKPAPEPRPLPTRAWGPA